MNGDRYVALTVILLTVPYLVSTFQLPSLEVGDPLGPKVFPVILGISLIGSALLLIRETKGRRATGIFSKEKRHFLLIGAVAALMLLYILLFEALGFILVNSLFLWILMSYFRRKRWVANTLISILFTLVVYSLFAKLLHVTLAKGILYF